MTCVIGLRRGNNIWIGADTEGFDAWGTIMEVNTPKVWKNGPFVFGSSGSYRAIQIVKHMLRTKGLLRKGTSCATERFMVTKLVPAIKNLLEQHGFSEKTNGVSAQSADFLIGVQGKLFRLQDDYSILELGAKFAAIGSGQPIAIGAMEILTQNSRMKPETIIERALTAVHKHLNTVGLPGKVLTTKDR